MPNPLPTPRRFTVTKPLGTSYSVDPLDVLAAKHALAALGHYRLPREGVNAIPDTALFEALRAFQKREGLLPDGVMKPGGPTEKSVALALRARSQDQQSVSSSPAAMAADKDKTSSEKDDRAPTRHGAGLERPSRGRAPSNDLFDNGAHGAPRHLFQRAAFTSGEGSGPPDGAISPPSEDLFTRPATRAERLAADALLRDLSQDPAYADIFGPSLAAKSDEEVEVALLPLLPAAVGAIRLTLLASRYAPQIAPQLFRQLAAPATAAALWTGQRAQQEAQRPAPLGMTVQTPPLPPTPGFEPSERPDSEREELLPADIPVLDISRPIELPAQPTIMVTPPITPHWSDFIVEHKGGERSRSDLEIIRDWMLDVFGPPGVIHTHGGRDRDTGDEKKEFRLPGPGIAFEDEEGNPGDSRRGSFYIDMTFQYPHTKDPRGFRRIHVQQVDTDRYGKPTKREIENALQIRKIIQYYSTEEENLPLRHSTGDILILVPKFWQIDKRKQRTRNQRQP